MNSLQRRCVCVCACDMNVSLGVSYYRDPLKLSVMRITSYCTLYIAGKIFSHLEERVPIQLPNLKIKRTRNER